MPYDDANGIWSPETDERQRAVAKYKEWLTDCNRFNIPIMVRIRQLLVIQSAQYVRTIFA